MATRKEILNALKSDMEDYIKSSRGYNTDPGEIFRGVKLYDEVPLKPAIGITVVGDTHKGDGQDGTYAGRDDRQLSILIYGYAENTDWDDVDSIYDLADDVVYFLYNDYTYTDDTYVGNIVISEGSGDTPKLLFELDILVDYTKSTNIH